MKCQKSQGKCVWQLANGRFVSNVGKSSWTSEEGMVNIRNIVFPKHIAADKLGVDLSFENRLQLQKQSIRDQLSSLQILPSIVEFFSKIIGTSITKKVKKFNPLFSNNHGLLLAAETTGNIRLAAFDAFNGNLYWNSLLNFDSSIPSSGIKDSKMIIRPDIGKNFAITITLKTADEKDYYADVVLNNSGIVSFSGFIPANNNFLGVFAEDSQIVTLVNKNSDMFVQNLDSSKSSFEYPSHSFFHVIDEEAGSMKIYKVDNANTNKLQESASIQFPSNEKIVAKAYSDPSVPIHSESVVAGDDTVMTKYLNPNMVGIVTVDPSCADNYANGPVIDEDESSGAPSMTFYLVDTVSGKFIHRMTVKYGAAPVHMALIENNVVVTYWNWKAKRTELLSISYFDGRLDKHTLNPLSSSSNPDIADMHKRANFSSFKTSKPLDIHKTYILPNSVIGISSTRSHKGITSKHALLALSTGQLYSLSLREINPRRPLKDPTNFEKEEGLMKYNAFLMLFSLSFVTLDDHMEFIRKNDVLIAVKSTMLESSAIVVSHWGGLDTHGNLVTPSQGYDTLSSDFNYGLLVALITSLGVAVYILKGQVKRKQTKMFWA